MSTAIAVKPRYETIDEMLRDFSDSISAGRGEESRTVEDQTAEQFREIRSAISLTRTPAVIQRLRELQDAWDGRDAEPPSEDLLIQAEKFWTAIDNELPRDFMRPTVRMSRDGYIAFSWVKPKVKKELHIWFHDGEPITYEVHMRTPTERLDNEEAKDIDVGNAVVQFFRS